MAQAGYTPISLYYSTTAAAVPVNTNLVSGELAINITDEKLYFKNAAGVVKLLASNATSAPVLTFSAGTTGFTPSSATAGAITLAGTLATTNGGTGLTSFTSGGVVYASSSSALATGSALTFDGTDLLLASGGLLDIDGTNAAVAMRIRQTTVGAGTEFTTAITENTGVTFDSSDSAGATARSFIWTAAGSEGMRLTSTGLGIKTSTPITPLTVQANSGGDATSLIGRSTGQNEAWLLWYKNGGSVTNAGILGDNQGLKFGIGSGLTEAARFDTSGNLLVGTTVNANSDKLVVNGQVYQFQTANGSSASPLTNGGYLFGPNSTTIYAGMRFVNQILSNNNTAIAFYTTSNAGSATERFRISGDGALGIGATPSYGTAGQVLTSGGPSAPPTWSTGGGGSTSPGGSNTQVQFNSSGSFGGSANFTFNGSGITTGFVNVNASTPPTAGMYYQSTATSGLSFYNTGALGGNSAVQIYYGRSSLAATTGGIDNSPVQWYGFGSGQTPQLTIGSTASIYYFQGHGYRLDSVPYVFTIRGGSRGDNGSYTVPESNGILYIDVGADYGGNGSTGRNCIYVKNDATGFGTSTNGVKVVNNFYGRQNAFYSLQKIGDPNGGGQNFGFYAQIDTSNGANDNAAPVGLVIDNALVDNYTKSNGNAQMAIFYDRRSGSTTRTAIQFYRNTTGNSVGLITTTNSATAYTTSSDYRLKENIAPLTGAIEKVLRLKPSTYTWKIDGSVGEGFIAHELQEVIPQAVSGDKDAEKLQQVEVEHAVSEVQDADGNIVSYGKAPVYEEKMMPVYQGVDTSFLVATLTAAIQEQQALIVALTARVEALEAK